MSKARKYWTEHLAAITTEGVSTKAYAKREGVAVASLYFWRRRLKAESAVSAVTSASSPSRFVAVRVEAGGAADRRPPCTAAFPPGLRLELAALPAPAWEIKDTHFSTSPATLL